MKRRREEPEPEPADPHAVAHDAISGLLSEGEIAVAWFVVIDAVGPDGTRYLAHRAGGGADGSDSPMVWQVLGMLEASTVVTRAQVADITVSSDEDPDDD